MGWEERNGKKYFYQKKRIGSRVYSLYMGKGKHAHNKQSIIEKKQSEEKVYRKLVEEEKKKDAELNTNHTRVNTLADAVLVVNGYHTHKGEWRKKRD